MPILLHVESLDYSMYGKLVIRFRKLVRCIIHAKKYGI